MPTEAAVIDRHATGAAADFASFLVKSRKLSDSAQHRALSAARESGERFECVLPRLGLVSERELAQLLAEFLDIPLAASDDFPAVPVLERCLGAEFLRRHRVLPLRESDGRVVLAMANPLDEFAADAVRFAAGMAVVRCVAYPSDLEIAFDRLYGSSRPNTRQAADLAAQKPQSAFAEDTERLRDGGSEAPVIRLVSLLIARAVESRASDIHIEPAANELRVRFRVDGILRQIESPPRQLAAAVLSRIKVMAKLNIAERRLPQDGRIATAVRGREIDVRVAISPTIHGERATLRILDRSQLKLEFADLGFDDSVCVPLRDVLAKSHGIFLVTGPTGSGKTTTLYAALSELNRIETNILTIEDPIEYQLPGINQAQVKPQIGLTFASSLRSFLRQDPDIMMVGEIRDLETAQIAVQAALTGHLVLSTVHTNDAASTVTRLLDMGVEDYLITSTLNGVAAQRLVRTLCTSCRDSYRPLPELLEKVGLAASAASENTFYRPRGCEVCNGTGYKGRSAILEVLSLTDELRQAVLKATDASELQSIAARSGMRTMRQHGLAKALAGETSLEEVLRVTKVLG